MSHYKVLKGLLFFVADSMEVASSASGFSVHRRVKRQLPPAAVSCICNFVAYAIATRDNDVCVCAPELPSVLGQLPPPPSFVRLEGSAPDAPV